MKVLHVLRQLNPGGIECWLDRIVSCWPRAERPEFHLVLEEQDFGVLAPQFIHNDVPLHYCPAPRNWIASARRFSEVLIKEGPFDVVHCHSHHASAFYLAIAAWHMVPMRICQSHADFRRNRSSRTFFRFLYEATASLALQFVSNVRLAVGLGAGYELFGESVTAFQILPCGTDFKPLLSKRHKAESAYLTLIHVGRLVPEKNHEFLFKLIEALSKVEVGARLLLVGDGPERGRLEELAQAMGIASSVEFLGNRFDVAELLLASDVFVFPSLAEGLGLAAIEAQAAGLPTLIAEHLPAEIELIPELCHRLALNLPIDVWVKSILELKSIPEFDVEKRKVILLESQFSIETNIKALDQIYAG